MGRQRNLDVHLFDRVVDGAKPRLARDLGATYHGGALTNIEALAPDIILECTGATPVIEDVVSRSAPSGIVCLAGVSSGGHNISLDLGEINRRMVLENDVIFGSVNANRTHYEAADWRDAFVRQPDDVKVIVEFEPAA